MFAIVKYASGVQQFVEITPISATDPGYGVPVGPDPGYGIPTFPHPGQGLPGAPVRPDQGLPIAPVRPSNPIVLPPGVWPPQLPPSVDNTLPLPPEASNKPIVLPPDPDLGIENPIVLPPLPAGVALLIALPQAAPKADTPTGHKPAILVQSGKKPVLVYVSAAATPK